MGPLSSKQKQTTVQEKPSTQKQNPIEQKAKPQKQDSFEDKELNQLKDTFIYLLDGNAQQNKSELLQQSININNFKRIFQNDEKFGEKLFNWFLLIQSHTTQNSNQDQITFNTFKECLEFMFTSSQKYTNPIFDNKKPFKLFEFFFLILHDYSLWQNFDHNIINITKQKALEFINHALLAYDLTEERTSKIILNTIFNNNNTTSEESNISMGQFLQNLEKMLEQLPSQISTYFKNKFFEKQLYLQIPELKIHSLYKNKDRIFFTKGQFLIFYLNGIGNSTQNCDGAYLLYSSAIDGISNQIRTFSLLGYDAPSLIIIKHKHEDDENNNNQQQQKARVSILGVYNCKEWENHWDTQMEYQGGRDNFLFSLFPKFNQIKVTNNNNKAFSYLNPKAFKGFQAGMGFGGDQSYQNFRLWIDDNLFDKSYIGINQSTYQSGDILDEQINKLNIIGLEFWGVGKSQNWQNQLEYRKRQSQLSEKWKKVDINSFISDIAEHTSAFKFKDQLHQNIDTIKSERDKHINQQDQQQQQHQQ